MLESASGFFFCKCCAKQRCQKPGVAEPRGTFRSKRAWYNRFMIEVSPNKQISVRIIRDGQAEPLEDEWKDSSPEERIEAVWTLTRLCVAWNNHLTDEPQLQRNITRIQRASR